MPLRNSISSIRTQNAPKESMCPWRSNDLARMMLTPKFPRLTTPWSAIAQKERLESVARIRASFPTDTAIGADYGETASVVAGRFDTRQTIKRRRPGVDRPGVVTDQFEFRITLLE